MKTTEGNSLEIAGVIIAIGFVAAWLTASGVTGQSNHYLPAAQPEGMSIPLARAQSHAQETATLAASTTMVIKGEISTRNPNALEAKFAMQRRLELLNDYLTQQRGSVMLGDVHYAIAGKTAQNKKNGDFVMVQQLEIRLPAMVRDTAFQARLSGLGIQSKSVERVALTSRLYK